MTEEQTAVVLTFTTRASDARLLEGVEFDPGTGTTTCSVCGYYGVVDDPALAENAAADPDRAVVCHKCATPLKVDGGLDA